MSRSRLLTRTAGPEGPEVGELERQGRLVARRVSRLRAQLTIALSERDAVAEALLSAGLSLSQAGRIIGGLCKERTRRVVNARRRSSAGAT